MFLASRELSARSSRGMTIARAWLMQSSNLKSRPLVVRSLPQASRLPPRLSDLGADRIDVCAFRDTYRRFAPLALVITRDYTCSALPSAGPSRFLRSPRSPAKVAFIFLTPAIIGPAIIGPAIIARKHLSIACARLLLLLLLVYLRARTL